MGQQFSDRRGSLDNDKGRGQKPRIDSNIITFIRDVVCSTVSTSATMADVSVGNCPHHSEHLHMSKVHTHWVLCLLKDSEERRVGDWKLFLKHYEKDGTR